MFYYLQFFTLPCLLIFFGNLSRNQQISVYNITKLYYYMILHPFCIMSLLCHVYTYKNAVKGMHTQIKIKLVMFFIICLSFLCNILLRHFVLLWHLVPITEINLVRLYDNSNIIIIERFSADQRPFEVLLLNLINNLISSNTQNKISC